MNNSISDRDKLDICRRLDVDRALELSPYKPPGGFKEGGQFADTRETVLAGIHKVRVAQKRIYTKEERAISRAWLYENGWIVKL